MIEKKRELNYLAVSYDTATKPKTSYPDELMGHITRLTGLKGGRAADIGCGRGDQLFALQRLGFQVTGLDIERSTDDIADHHVCDVGSEVFPLADDTLDLTFSKAVIEHLYIPQIEHFMLEMKRVTRPGGYVVLMTPDWRYMYRDFYLEYTHVTPFTERSLEQCMKMYGLRDVQVQSFIQLPQVWRQPWLKNVCDVINVLPLPKTSGKWVRWSKERVLLAVGRKA
ncbi:MAG: methyltransferase domain-containing protein [Aquabacterium sp.]